MIEITDHIYRLVAERLREEIGAAEWINTALEGAMPFLPTAGERPGSDRTAVAVGSGGVEALDSVGWRLILTAIVYRRTETLPEGVRRPVGDIVPVWWEFRTAVDGSPVPTNFSFSELKPYLIDYD